MTRPRVCYIYSEQPDYVRSEKVLKTLTELEADFFYIGCCRGNQKKRPIQSKSNQKYFVADFSIPHGGFLSALNTLRFICYAIYKVLKIQPKLIIAVNEELALPFVIFFPTKKVICEAYDSLSMRSSKKRKILNKILKTVSRFVLSKCNALVEVSADRLNAHEIKPPKSIVVPNSLNKKNYPDIKTIPEKLKSIVSNKKYIFVSGSFSDNINGLEELLKAIELLDDDLTVIAAGRPNGKWVNTEFIRHRLVRYIGVLSSSEATFVASKSKALFAYYKPISDLYKYAAPNKIFDAMALGVPILMNKECFASRFPEDNAFGLSASYEDINLLSKNLGIVSSGALKYNPSEVIKLFEAQYEWSVTSKKYKELVNFFLQN